MFASLFGTDAATVERSLLFRTISTGTGVGKKGSVYSVPQNPEEAIYSRDALAKTLYSRCVLYLHVLINIVYFVRILTLPQHV